MLSQLESYDYLVVFAYTLYKFQNILPNVTCYIYKYILLLITHQKLNFRKIFF